MEEYGLTASEEQALEQHIVGDGAPELETTDHDEAPAEEDTVRDEAPTPEPPEHDAPDPEPED